MRLLVRVCSNQGPVTFSVCPPRFIFLLRVIFVERASNANPTPHAFLRVYSTRRVNISLSLRPTRIQDKIAGPWTDYQVLCLRVLNTFCCCLSELSLSFTDGKTIKPTYRPSGIYDLRSCGVSPVWRPFAVVCRQWFLCMC